MLPICTSLRLLFGKDLVNPKRRHVQFEKIWRRRFKFSLNDEICIWYHIGYKTTWEKEKILVTINVFQCFSQCP